MKINNTEIAKVGLCTEGAVRAAKVAGRLDVESLESVLGFVLAGRLKAVGIGYCDDLWGVSVAKELHYEPDESQEEGSW